MKYKGKMEQEKEFMLCDWKIIWLRGSMFLHKIIEVKSNFVSLISFLGGICGDRGLTCFETLKAWRNVGSLFPCECLHFPLPYFPLKSKSKHSAFHCLLSSVVPSTVQGIKDVKSDSIF